MDFIGEEEEFVDQSKKRKQGGRPAINKKNKLTLVFDPEARKRFLTGFRKRKQERKEKYQEKLERELAEEKLRSREEAKKTVAKKQSSSHSVLPEVEHLLESSSDEEDDPSNLMAPSTFSIGHTTVSISSLGNKLFPTALATLQKEEQDRQDGHDDNSDQDDDAANPLLKYGIPYKPEPDYAPGERPSLTPEEKDALKLKKLKSVLKNPRLTAAKAKTETMVRKETYRLLQHSDIYKKTLRIKQQRSKKFKLNRLQPQEEGGSGSGPPGKNKSSKKVEASKIKVKSRGRVAK